MSDQSSSISGYDIIRTIRDQERRRTQLSRTQSMGVALTTSTGAVNVKGGAVSGSESVVDVTFRVQYVKQPFITFGYEIVAPAYSQGKMPSMTAMVVAWESRHLTDDRIYTVGARLGIVIISPEIYQIKVHWVAVGKAFRNPIEPTDEI